MSHEYAFLATVKAFVQVSSLDCCPFIEVPLGKDMFSQFYFCSLCPSCILVQHFTTWTFFSGIKQRFFIFHYLRHLLVQVFLVAAITDFFLGAHLPTGISSANLILIPKKDKPTDCRDFRPISLCNFSHKVISKILADRLSIMLPNIISREQTGFVKGRSIHENISLAHEMIGTIDNKVIGGNIAVKLDMAKAYDRVSWRFLLRVLKRFGFSNTWIDLIFRLISNCRYSVSINRKTGGSDPEEAFAKGIPSRLRYSLLLMTPSVGDYLS